MVVSSVVWVPAGCADPKPQRYKLSKEEIEQLQTLGEADIDDAESDDEVNSNNLGIYGDLKDSDFPADLRMDEYGDEEKNEVNVGELLIHDDLVEDEEEEGKITDAVMESARNAGDESDDDDDSLGDVPDTREFVQTDVDGLMDMGISKSRVTDADIIDDPHDSDHEDTDLVEGDCLILAGKTDEDFATLEVMLYNRKSGNLYVHHDIPLPSYPLCLSHGDVNPVTGNAGNFCAVGTFETGIEIWDLDVLDVLEPVHTLGGLDTRMEDELSRINMARAAVGKKLKKKSFSSNYRKLKEGSHTDAVMALSWNKVHRQVISSGSADYTVKLWDITSLKGPPASTFTHHKGKVQSVVWHPKEGTILATGGYDRNVFLVDARSKQGGQKKQRIPTDCESLCWDPFKDQNLTCASEDGTICCWDVRKFDDGPIWSYVAHEYGVSEISYCDSIPGMMATCSVDQTVALWDAHTISDHSHTPKACGSKEMKVGKLYSVSFYPSAPWLLTAAGASKELSVWDLTREQTITNAFGNRNTSDSQNDENVEPIQDKDFEAMMAAEKKEVEKTASISRMKGKKKKKGKKKVYKK